MAHGQGNINYIKNNRPISNLCLTSQVFEKVILKRKRQAKDENKVDLSGVQPHRFKQTKSTETGGLIIQSFFHVQ
jgi:hypothetical protein